MAVYRMNEAAFDLPDADLTDRTVTELSFDGGSPESCSLTIHRQKLAQGDSLVSLVAANLREAERALPSHAVIFQRGAEVAGAPAIDVATQWRGERSVLYTRQIHVAIHDVWLVFAGNAPLGARARCDALLDQTVTTVVWSPRLCTSSAEVPGR